MDIHCAPGFVGGVAQGFQRAVGTFWPACNAQRASMQDNLVREDDPLAARNCPHQILLDLLRIGVLRKLQTPRDALYVRIYHHTVGDLEPRAQNHIGGLAGHAGDLQQLVHGARDLPPKSLISLRAAPTTDFALLRKHPVERMSGSSSSGLSAANDSRVGYLAKITGVTILTRTSVHCAERMVATSSSQALL